MKGLAVCLFLVVAAVFAQQGAAQSDDDLLASAASVSNKKTNYYNNDDLDRSSINNRDSGYSSGSSSNSYDSGSSSYGSGSSSYGSGSSNDHGSYGSSHAADSSYGYGASYGGGDEKLGSFVHALTAFLPIGLFLAAIVPNIITINTGRRRRSDDAVEVSEDVSFPILDMISSYGFRSLQEPTCQSKITCELGRMGGLPEANAIQKALWIGANFVPDRVARLIGIDHIVSSIRKRQCDTFVCGARK